MKKIFIAPFVFLLPVNVYASSDMHNITTNNLVEIYTNDKTTHGYLYIEIKK